MPFDSFEFTSYRSVEDREVPEAKPAARDVGAERLRILADFLDALPAERFNIDHWASSLRFEECGTAACACGWATTIPAFRATGLRLAPITYRGVEGGIDLLFGDYTGISAAAAFFKLRVEDAARLFYGMHYRGSPSAREVAARIREHLADRAIAKAEGPLT